MAEPVGPYLYRCSRGRGCWLLRLESEGPEMLSLGGWLLSRVDGDGDGGDGVYGDDACEGERGAF